MSAPRPRPSSPTPERRVGPYQVLARIGEGGMGVVHLAKAPDGSRVALKVLRPHVVGDDEGRQRLAREVASLRKVHSPHVAEIIDADPWGELAFIVTRYVPGDSLSELVRRDGPVRGRDLDHLADHLLAAIQDVHASGVLHRDVKPTNVVMEGRSPVLIDFGLARLAEDPAMTATGILLGTPGYLAPELLFGEEPTPAVDVHGWAATVCFAATGGSPYGRGHTMAILDRTRRGEVMLDDVPASLRPLLEASLVPDALDRPTTREVAAALERLRGDDGPTTALRAVPTDAGSHADHTMPWQAVAHRDPTTRVNPVSGEPPTTVTPPVNPPTTRWPAPAPVPALAPTSTPTPTPTQVSPAWPAPPHPSSIQPVPRMPPVDGHVGPHGERYRERLTGWARLLRALLLFSAVLLVATGAALAPYPTLAILGVVVVLARAVARSRESLWRRRMMRGTKWSDRPRSVLGFPWHLVVAVLGGGVLLGVAVIAAGAVVTAAIVLGATTAQALLAGGVVLTWVAWWGPGSEQVRRTLLPLLDRTAHRPPLGLACLGIVLLSAVALWALQNANGTSWVPDSSPPWSGLKGTMRGWLDVG